MAQSFTLSNYFHKTPGEFKFGHNIGRIEIYEIKLSTLTPFLPPTPGWPLKIWLSTQWHNLSPSLTFSTRHLANSKFGHNIGRIEIYENKFSTLTPFLPPIPWVGLKTLTIHTMAQSFTLSNFFHKTPGKFKIGHNIGRVEIYKNKFSTFSPIPPSYPWVALKKLTIHTMVQSFTLS